MDLLQTAADKYKQLLDKEYSVVLGKNKQLFSYKLTFTKYDFKHITGLHKLKDLPDVYAASSEKLYDDIIKKRLDLSDISNSSYIAEPLNRLNNLIYLENYLDAAQVIYQWDKSKSSFSDIDANIMISIPSTPFNGETTYIFFKSYDDNKMQISDFFTDSVVKENPVSLFSTKRNYTKGQVRPPILLYKDKADLSMGNKIILLDKLSHNQSLQNQQSNKNQPMQMSITEDKPMQIDFSMQGGAAAMTLNPQMPNNEFFTRIANAIAKGVDSLLHKKSDTKRTQVEISDRQQPTPQQSENKTSTPTKAPAPQPVPQKQSLKAMMSKAAQQKKDMVSQQHNNVHNKNPNSR